MSASPYAIGTPEFIEEVSAELSQRRRGGARDSDLALPRPHIDVDRIDAAVAGFYGIARERLVGHGRLAPEAKRVAVELARQLTGWTQRRIGEQYGSISSQVVGQMARRFREDKALADTRKTLENLRSNLTG